MIKFYQKRKIFYTISILVIIIGIVCLFVNGVDLDIEFEGGAILKYQMTGDVSTKSVDDLVTSAMSRSASCQISTDNATGVSYLVINFSGKDGLSSEEQTTLDTALKAAYPENSLSLYETTVVSPFIGKQFLVNGIKAIVFAFIMIILYVWYSFRKIGGLSAGIMALIALLHDCLIIFFAFIIFKIPLNENFIAALLTIIGFSVNDTIVIYDRIRENMLKNPKMDIEELVDKSVSQSLTRSINTSLAVFFSIVIVCIFAQIYGIDSILSFAFPMTFGVISGCYSSVCLAGPLWVSWKKHKEKVALAAKADRKAKA
jgi:preprotein translocase SecF subunit